MAQKQTQGSVNTGTQSDGLSPEISPAVCTASAAEH